MGGVPWAGPGGRHGCRAHAGCWRLRVGIGASLERTSKNVGMPPTDLLAMRESLRENDPARLVGLEVGVWLSVRDAPYRLDDPADVDELIKDVVALVNSDTGGLVLVGFATRREGGAALIDSVCPVRRRAVDLDQYRSLIASHVVPVPEGVQVSWVDWGDEQGVLVIDIPAQQLVDASIAATASAREDVEPARSSVRNEISGGVAGAAVQAHTINGGIHLHLALLSDGSQWAPQDVLSRLAQGVPAGGGGLSRDVLAALAAHAASVSPRGDAYDVGVGVPGWQRQFQRTYEVLNHTTAIGAPISELYWDGPGVVQDLERVGASPGWVLCALPARAVTAVPQEIWEALHTAGSGAPGIEAMTALGFPATDSSSTLGAEPIIAPEATSVDLVGGMWGPGHLVRPTAAEPWRWEPTPRFDFTMSRSARNWTGGFRVPKLRVRALATLPWSGVADLRIDPAQRRRVSESLLHTDMAGTLTVLSHRRGAALTAGDWTRGPNRNALDAASYSRVVTTADGRPALSLEVMVALPGAMQSAVVTCAELRVDDVEAWADALRAGGVLTDGEDLLLSWSEIAEFLTAASQMAVTVLPEMVTAESATMRWTSPPTVEIRLSTEDLGNTTGPPPLLTDMIDFTPFGTSDRTALVEMAVTITAPPRLTADARRDLTRQAIEHMAHGFGFLDATEDDF